MMEYKVDAAYHARCIRKLKEWGAPLSGWYCVDMEELDDNDFTCELCGYEGIKYVHIMRHDEYFEDVEVGCICAGIMEGDILAAKNRDREFRNRAKRRRNFPKRKWKETRNGNWYLKYKGQMVFINQNGSYYNCACGDKRAYRYKGKGINNFLSACYAAFDLADPVSEVGK